MKTAKLLVFDSHPVQYRVPIWQALESHMPGCVHVVYASDCSVRGHNDKGFGRNIAWDEPMLAGYAHTILNCEKGVPLSGWKSLTGKGVREVMKTLKPEVILLTGFNYRFDLIAYVQAISSGIPVWLRCETQDKAIYRSRSKSLIRSLVYWFAYRHLNKIFFIGELNRSHYLRHGLAPHKLRAARYGTLNRFACLEVSEKVKIRNEARKKAGVSPGDYVVGFSGKFIPKKNPDLLFQMLNYLPEKLRRKTHLYFLGSGPLEVELKALAKTALEQYKVQSYFAGFVNQSQLASHYLCMDVLVLPSRRMGETWGLVVNEALQAGCGVVVSDAVGCGADFSSWERFRVFNEGAARELATCVAELSEFSRNFEWATQKLNAYSLNATVEALDEELKALKSDGLKAEVWL